MSSLNYYNVLNIKTNATEKDIKKAYRALAKKYHPDTYQGDKNVAQEKMQEINIAYDTLSDAGLRKEYDKKLGLNAEVKSDVRQAKVNQTTNNPNYDKSGVNYEVHYRPNNSKIEYNSNGYATANYYTAGEDDEPRYSLKYKMNALNAKQKLICILIIGSIALVFVSLTLYKAYESLSSLVTSAKDISSEITSAKAESDKQFKRDSEELKNQFEESINGIKDKIKEKTDEIVKQTTKDSKAKTLEEWGITDKDTQDKLLDMIEELKKDEIN